MEEKRGRVWEIDLLRGISIILMVLYHVFYDLRNIYNFPFFYYPIFSENGPLFYLVNFFVIIFILISGISCSFSKSNAKRGIKILVVALVISLISYIYSPDLMIKFGILHFFGVSMILYPLFKHMNNFMLILLGTLIIAAGGLASHFIVSSPYLFPFGLISPGFTSSDYYPLLPWMGVFLYGIVAGRIFYKDRKSLFSFDVKENVVMYLGRHTLIVYIAHQPLALLIFGLIFGNR